MMQLTIIGFGNQAKSWAQNLRDSDFPVKVALRPLSSSIQAARNSGFDVIEIGSEAFFSERVFALLIPDHLHEDFFLSFGPRLSSGSTIIYAHGFSVTRHNFQSTYPDLQHVLFAPKSIGSELRRQFEVKGKLGAVYSLEYYRSDKEAFVKWMLGLASSLGINLGPYETTFENETRADLYSEQGLLCSLVPYAAEEMFRNLIEEGIEPELAYFECWHELKLIVNAMVEMGPLEFFNLISPNALVGSEKGYQQLFTTDFRTNLKLLLKEVRNGAFEKELDKTDINEVRETIAKRWANSPLTKTHKKIHQDSK